MALEIRKVEEVFIIEGLIIPQKRGKEFYNVLMDHCNRGLLFY